MKVFLYNKPANEINHEFCLVEPINTNWNDFGIQAKVRLVLSLLGKEIVLQAYYAAFIENEFVTLSPKLKENTNDYFPIKQYILLESVKEYDKLRHTFPDNFDQILKELNDLSYFRMQKNRNANFNHFLKSDIFNKSFIRANSSFQAYLYGFTGLISSLTINIKNISAKNPLTNEEIFFEINSDSETLNFLPFRHFTLIGRNGTGKSQTLRKFAHKYKNSNKFNCVISFSQFDKSNSFSKNIKNIKHINLTKSNKNLEILQSIIRIKLDDQNFEEESFEILIDLLKNIKFMQNIVLYKDKHNFLQLDKLFEFYSGEQSNLEKIQEIMTFTNLKIKNGVNFHNLSSGENYFINLILNLIDITNHYKSNILYLFDEPESFLHPNFISIISEIICYFTNRLYSIAITATHSIYLVKNSLQQNIAIFRNDENNLKIERPSFNTFGSNLNSLSYFIFGFESPLEHEESVIRKIIEIEQNSKISFQNLIDKYGKYLSAETIDRIFMKLLNEEN
jgi:ABC-type cobalamin/Fe3+-siderophores transport system ATPase subunit